MKFIKYGSHSRDLSLATYPNFGECFLSHELKWICSLVCVQHIINISMLGSHLQPVGFYSMIMKFLEWRNYDYIVFIKCRSYWYVQPFNCWQQQIRIAWVVGINIFVVLRFTFNITTQGTNCKNKTNRTGRLGIWGYYCRWQQGDTYTVEPLYNGHLWDPTFCPL